MTIQRNDVGIRMSQSVSNGGLVSCLAKYRIKQKAPIALNRAVRCLRKWKGCSRNLAAAEIASLLRRST